MTFKQMKTKRDHLVASVEAMEKKKRTLENQIDALKVDISKLEGQMAPLCDHDWVWRRRHSKVDKCAVCQKRRLISARPDNYEVRRESSY